MTQMTHQEALEDLAVERYLLDELTGDARDRFEEHLFDCASCTADLKAGLLFLEAAKQELPAQAPAPNQAEPIRAIRNWWNALLQPLILAPALAASLAVVVYQSAVLLPRVESQLAEAHTPSVVDTLVLANAGPRGDGALPEVSASANGAYLLAVDLPPAPGASAYRCTLYDSTGKAVWHTDVVATQNLDSIKIQVPAAATGSGNNRMEVQAIGPHEENLTGMTRYQFTLRINK